MLFWHAVPFKLWRPRPACVHPVPQSIPDANLRKPSPKHMVFNVEHRDKHEYILSNSTDIMSSPLQTVRRSIIY